MTNISSIELVDQSWSLPGYPKGAFGPLLRVCKDQRALVSASVQYYDDISTKAICEISDYASSFLASPNPDLGREGDVCPFVGIAIEKRTLFVCSTDVQTIDDAENAVAEMATTFLSVLPESPVPGECANKDQIFKSIVMAFPFVSPQNASLVIDGLQESLKSRFILNGLMIGQFHPTCPEPGLHNEDFRPLQAPIPCLAIRHITKFDAPFMTGSIEHMNAYLKIFGDEGRARLEKCIERLN